MLRLSLWLTVGWGPQNPGLTPADWLRGTADMNEKSETTVATTLEPTILGRHLQPPREHSSSARLGRA